MLQPAFWEYMQPSYCAYFALIHINLKFLTVAIVSVQKHGKWISCMLVHIYEQNISSINILITRPTGISLIARLNYSFIFYIVLNFLYFCCVFRGIRHWTIFWSKWMMFAFSHRIQIFFRYYFPIYIYLSLMASSFYVFRPRLFI
jgi:hypothetical protein